MRRCQIFARKGKFCSNPDCKKKDTKDKWPTQGGQWGQWQDKAGEKEKKEEKEKKMEKEKQMEIEKEKEKEQGISQPTAPTGLLETRMVEAEGLDKVS